MANAWITHVKSMSKKLGISYTSALSDQRVRDGYVRSTKGVPDGKGGYFVAVATKNRKSKM